jgi:transcriptional regulator with XRE-family HTH domain
MAGLCLLRAKHERHKRGWSQSEVVSRANAHGANITQNLLSQIELGRVLPTPETLEALAQTFLISPPSVLMKPCGIPDPEPEQEGQEVTS